MITLDCPNGRTDQLASLWQVFGTKQKDTSQDKLLHDKSNGLKELEQPFLGTTLFLEKSDSSDPSIVCGNNVEAVVILTTSLTKTLSLIMHITIISFVSFSYGIWKFLLDILEQI